MNKIIFIKTTRTQNFLDKAIYYYHNDHLGTPKVMTNQAGDVVWEAIYEPFGEVDRYLISRISNNFRFPGQYEDELTGFYYNHHRYYKPDLARYNKVESFHFQLLFLITNNYSYSFSNPITKSDAKGLFPIYSCIKDKEKEAKSLNKTDAYKHCYASCTIQRDCFGGRFTATLAGIIKEIKDIFTSGNAELRDLMNDYRGIVCGTYGIAKGLITDDSKCCEVEAGQCKKCCDCLSKHKLFR